MILSSGELAKLIGVTKQTIMNYRKKGMPYCSMTLWGAYEYDFKAIQWLFDNGYKTARVQKIPLAYRYEMILIKMENERLKKKVNDLIYG